jgi:hypothetical protein
MEGAERQLGFDVGRAEDEEEEEEEKKEEEEEKKQKKKEISFVGEKEVWSKEGRKQQWVVARSRFELRHSASKCKCNYEKQTKGRQEHMYVPPQFVMMMIPPPYTRLPARPRSRTDIQASCMMCRGRASPCNMCLAVHVTCTY